MSLLDIGNAAHDQGFQRRCMAALWNIANDVFNNTPIADSGGNSLITQSGIGYAQAVLSGRQQAPASTIAMQVLRNDTINASVANATDSDIQWQIKEIWFDLVAIG